MEENYENRSYHSLYALMISYAHTFTRRSCSKSKLEEAFKENMTVEEAKELFFTVIKSAVSRDVMSGDGADFLTIASEIQEESIKF